MSEKTNFILNIYKDKRTVFTFNDLGMMLGETDQSRLKQRINYHVRNRNILNLRKGIYAKKDYNPEELACKINTPCYLSLEYVLRKKGLIFQYSGNFTLVSYLSRVLEIDSFDFAFRKIKKMVLMNTAGIERLEEGINIACAERAFLDLVYLDKEFYLDHPELINKEKLFQILPVYESAKMEKRINKILRAKD